MKPVRALAAASRALAYLVVGALLTATTDAQENNNWMRHFRVGALVGLNIKANFKMSGPFAVSGSQPGAAGVSGADHFYDDGYVRVDDTGNAQGYTSFWGYNSASQLNSVAQTLTFHSARSFNQTGNATVDAGADVGLDVAYGGNIFPWARGVFGWEVGFGFLPISIQDSRKYSATFTRTVHRFNTGPIVVPEAPYNGGSSGVGPTIPDTPTALPDDVSAGTIKGSRMLNATLYSLKLGPTLQWELHRRWAVAVSGGPAAGFVESEYKFKETIVLADGSQTPNSGKFGKSKIVYGGYVGATLMFHTDEQADIYVGAQLMSLGGMTVSGMGREATLDLGTGVYFSAGANWPF